MNELEKLQRNFEKNIDKMIHHPIGKVLLLNLKLQGNATFTLTTKGELALVDDLYKRALNQENLWQPLDEINRLCTYFVKRLNFKNFEQIFLKIVNQLGGKLKQINSAIDPKLNHIRQAVKFLGGYTDLVSKNTTSEKSTSEKLTAWQIIKQQKENC